MTAPFDLLGVRTDLSNAAYHAGPGLSVSGVKRFRRTPYHFARLREPTAPAKAPSAGMFNGTLVHCATLEPEEFDRRYVVAPDVSKSSRAYRDFAEEVGALGLEPVTLEQRDAAFAQAHALRQLEDVAPLLADGRPEVSAFWRDPDTGILCKCRPDWVSEVAYGTGVVLLDVKTTGDASATEFARTCGKFGYHLQADWYCSGYAIASGLEVYGMVFAVVENEFPYAVQSFMLGDASLARAREANRLALAKYAQCEASRTWPGYPPTIQVIDIPSWA